jgi:hypothetical protein
MQATMGATMSRRTAIVSVLALAIVALVASMARGQLRQYDPHDPATILREGACQSLSRTMAAARVARDGDTEQDISFAHDAVEQLRPSRELSVSRYGDDLFDQWTRALRAIETANIALAGHGDGPDWESLERGGARFAVAWGCDDPYQLWGHAHSTQTVLALTNSLMP